MDEVRARIITDTSTLKRQSDIAQLSRPHGRYADVDRFTLHVKALLGHARGVRPKELIAPRRAIPADDLNLSFGVAQGSGKIPKQVEQPWFEVMNVAGAVIAKKIIELFQCFRVSGTNPVDNVNAFAGVRMIEAQPVFSSAGRGGQSSVGRKSSCRKHENCKVHHALQSMPERAICQMPSHRRTFQHGRARWLRTQCERWQNICTNIEGQNL